MEGEYDLSRELSAISVYQDENQAFGMLFLIFGLLVCLISRFCFRFLFILSRIRLCFGILVCFLPVTSYQCTDNDCKYEDDDDQKQKIWSHPDEDYQQIFQE